MKVLFATDRPYLPQAGGGTESSTHDLCSWFHRRSISVAVLASLGPKGGTWLRNRVMYKIRPSHKVPMDRAMGYPVFRGWHPLEGVREVASRFGPDIAIIQARQPMMLVARFLDQHIPCVVYVRGLDFHKWQEQAIQMHSALCFLANSEFTAGEFARELGLEAGVIPPLIDAERYRVESKRNRVLFVNPIESKGSKIGFRLAASRPDIVFEFVESWGISENDWRLVKARADSLENIILKRRVRDMRSVYANAKVVLIPSIVPEGWGRVATEAQVSGIPVLGSDRGGLRESVGPGGILVDPEADISVWEQALSQLWDDSQAYDRYSAAAFDYSMRPEIQPELLITKLISHISEYLETVK